MHDGYRPVAGRARTLVVLLTICGTLGALGALLSAAQLLVFHDAAAVENPQTPGQIAVLFGVGCEALVYVLVFLATVVVWAMFVHRSCANAHALGAVGMEFTPGWAAGWYFVPIANLFKPIQAMQEIYRATDPGADARNFRWRPVPSLLNWWWGAWVVSNLLGGMIGRLALSSNLPALGVSVALDVLDGALDVVLCVLAVRVVRQIASRQEQKARVAAFA